MAFLIACMGLLTSWAMVAASHAVAANLSISTLRLSAADRPASGMEAAATGRGRRTGVSIVLILIHARHSRRERWRAAASDHPARSLTGPPFAPERSPAMTPAPPHGNAPTRHTLVRPL